MSNIECITVTGEIKSIPSDQLTFRPAPYALLITGRAYHSLHFYCLCDPLSGSLLPDERVVDAAQHFKSGGFPAPWRESGSFLSGSIIVNHRDPGASIKEL